MQSEMRRGLRLILHLVHIAVQLSMIWVVMEVRAPVKEAETLAQIQSLQVLIGHIGAMMGIFFIYWTLYHMLSRSVRGYSDSR